nr:FtsX-like permease family protein [Luteimonas salinisoli]
MVVSRYRPLPEAEKLRLRQQALQVSETRLVDITLTHLERWKKVRLKVVDGAYPVQGRLAVGRDPAGGHEPVDRGPTAGEIWVDPRLFTELQLELGQTLMVGGEALSVSRILFHEPDRILEGHSVAPRAMVNRASLKGLSLNAEKTHYRYLVNAGPARQREIASLLSTAVPDAQIITRENGRHPLALFWKRAENFIGLSSVLLFFMAAIAIDLAGRRRLSMEQKRLALYMSMGMGLNQGIVMALGQWLLGFLVSLLAGMAFAYGASLAVLQLLQAQFPGIAPDWRWVELGKSILLVFLLLLSFQLPGFIQLRSTSVVALMRGRSVPSGVLARSGWTLACLAGLAGFYSDNWTLTGMALAAMLCSVLIMMLATWLLLIGGEKLTRTGSGLLPFTLFVMRKRLLSKSTQVMGFGLCCTLLLFTLMLMKDIGETLEANRRINDGNLVIAKADPDQLAAIRHWSESTGSRIRQIRPFASAQLVAVNDRPLKDFVRQPSDSAAALTAPIRLSWSDRVPVNNRVVSGRWWPSSSGERREISVESEVATDMGFELGDKLTFMAGDELLDLAIVATHAYQPGNGSVTFWFQVPEAVAERSGLEVFYMGSMELPEDAWEKLSALWRPHPTLALVPLKEITERFDNVLAMITKLILGFSSMIVLMASIVVAASVRGFEQEERIKNGLLLSMGLDRFDCLKLNLYEWLVTASIAAVGAMAGSWVAGASIYQSQFAIAYRPDPVWMGSITLATMVAVCGIGLFYYHTSLKSSVGNLLTE